MIRGATYLLLIAIGLTACSKKNENRVAFDGQYFKAKAKKVDDTLAPFTVEVEKVSVSLDGALAAGGYEGTKYCIANFGTSSIIWTVGPDTEISDLVITDDSITLQGTCNP